MVFKTRPILGERKVIRYVDKDEGERLYAR